MDLTLAKTFLAIAESGSFKEAAGRLHVTQSTVSLRMKTLEAELGRLLFERSKAGTRLTPAGSQFQRHATALIRVWRHAQLEVALAESHEDHLAVGGQTSLWEGFLLPWIARLRTDLNHIAVSAAMGVSNTLMERLIEGSLDLAIVYRAHARPGVMVEHLLDEELVLVSSGDKDLSKPDEGYVFVNWGPEFSSDHADAYPELTRTGLNLNLGAVAITYLLTSKSSGYFPLRIAKPYISDGRLRVAKRAPRFVYPVFAAYPEHHDENAYREVLESLRAAAERISEEPVSEQFSKAPAGLARR